jgi:hypothetical protein
MKRIHITGFAALALLALASNACSALSPVPTPTSVDVGAVQTAAMQTAMVELTRLAPTITPSPTITPTPTITPSPTITPTSTPLHLTLAENIGIYFPNVLDAEACKYENLPIPINHGFTGDKLRDVEVAVRYLLNTKWAQSGYLTNPLGISRLYFTSIEVTGTDMKLTLGGEMIRHDDQCLNNQARDQLWATVWTSVNRYEYPVIKTISIWVDLLLFDDVMLSG